MNSNDRGSFRKKPDWNSLNDKKSTWIYRILRWWIWLFFPKYRIEGAEKLPSEPCVIVGNHCQMYGPVAAELYTPVKHQIWCAGEMMNRKEVADYAYRDFWSGKPRAIRWLFRILSFCITPLALILFRNAHTIPVYHDLRLKNTFRLSLENLQEGSSLVIFPECYDEHNDIVHEFQERFVDLARYYYKETGRELSFVPLYLAPRLKTMIYGEPIRFSAEAPIAEERRRICGELMDAITEIAQAQPEHTVIPYPNIPKKLYPKNTPGGASGMERKAYDYSGFSLKKLNDPRFSHVKLLGGWIGYFSLYFLTENLIPAERCHVIHCALDDCIPFCEAFAVFYVGWYLLVAGSLAYTLFYKVEAFRKIQIYIMITQAAAMLCYILYPSIQNLRPDPFPRENGFTWLLGVIYAFDTPTGVFPSLHVAYSIGILSVACKDRELHGAWKAALTVFVVLVCAAVCFVKQHSFLDVAAALPVCLLAEILVFGKDYWAPRIQKMHVKTA